jgi:polyhydroxyalkanoate synthesis repressor PhaR
MNDTVEITRYPNRRLYDRSRKKYVTVGDIEAMVLAGQDVHVRDSKSDDDLTRVILTQIILERHPERMKMFPVAFLHAILRADQLALNWLTVYFGQALNFLERITRSPRPSALPGMDFWQSLLPGSAKNVAKEASAGDVPVPEEEQATEDEAAAQRGMAAKLAEMELRIKQLEGDASNKD